MTPLYSILLQARTRRMRKLLRLGPFVDRQLQRFSSVSTPSRSKLNSSRDSVGPNGKELYLFNKYENSMGMCLKFMLFVTEASCQKSCVAFGHSYCVILNKCTRALSS